MGFRGKILRRIIIILGSFWLLLLLMLYFTSGKYRDHAISILKSQLDKNLLTEIQIQKDDIHVSLLRNFPNASISLRNIFIRSAPGPSYRQFEFEAADTLLSAGKVDLIINLRSFLTRKYVLRRITIEDASLNILSDSKGINNYRVWRSSAGEDTTGVSFDLKKIELEKVDLNYIDSKSRIRYTGFITEAVLSGSFSGDDFNFSVRAEALKNHLWVTQREFNENGIIRAQGAIVKEKGVYTFSDFSYLLFGIGMEGEGKYAVADGTFRFNFSAESAPLQKLTGSVKELYGNSVDIDPQKGQISLQVAFSGNRKTATSVNLGFKIEKGVFTNKETHLKVEDVLAIGNYTNGKGRNVVTSRLTLDTLVFNSGQSKLSVTGSIENFISPQIIGKLKCDLQAEKLLVIKSLSERLELSGRIYGDMEVFGSLPSAKNITMNDLKRVKMKGVLNLDHIRVKLLRDPLPAATLSGQIRMKNLAEIELEQMHLIIGNSNLILEGAVTDLPVFAGRGSGLPLYECKIQATDFHVEDFLSGSRESEEESLYMAFPDSLILQANVRMDNFYFGKFTATQVKAFLIYTPGRLKVDSFSMRSQGGEIHSNLVIKEDGTYIITQGEADFRRVDISDLFYAFNEFNQGVITHEYIDGILTGSAVVSAAWDHTLHPLYDKLRINSDITIEKGELINYQPLMGLSDFIEVEELKHIRFDRLDLDVTVMDEKVKIAQTDIRSSAIWLTGSGEHDFRNNYTYRFQAQLADVLWKKAKQRKPQNTEFGYVVDDGLGRTILPLKITGTDTVFTVSYDRATAGSVLKQKVQEEKHEWRDLLRSGSNKEEQEIRLEWEEDADSAIEDVTTGEEQEKDDFMIHWEDE